MITRHTRTATPPDPSPSIREAIPLSLRLLDRHDRRKYYASVVIQMALALLDLAGVVLVGLVGVFAVAGLQPDATLPSYVSDALARFGLEREDLLVVALYFAVAAALFLSVKSVAAVALIRRVLRFLAGQQAKVASRLTDELFSRPLTVVERRTSQETAYALVDGTLQATVILLGSLAVGLSDVALLVLLGATLLVFDPLITVVAIVFFVGLAVILQRVLGRMASRAGNAAAAMSIASTEGIQEAVASYREIAVSSKRSLYRDRVADTIRRAAYAQADAQFVAQVPKFVFETALVVGALALVATQSLGGSPAEAVGTMTLFLAAGARVMPSLLRLQVSLINLRNASGRAAPIYSLDAELSSHFASAPDFNSAKFEAGVASGHAGFTPTVELAGVYYTYPDAESATIRDITFTVSQGTSLALVGGTGAGKSTLADLILGVLRPDEGTILISGRRPEDAAAMWPGAVAYVPQAVSVKAGTIRENVALGLGREVTDDRRVWEALERAHIASYLRSQRSGLDTIVGERGVKLSGGQRQRLGLARALYSQPKLLVLDEATSALDAETEAAITSMLQELAGTVTTITIAHRLATVRQADIVVYLEGGQIAATGTFDEVRATQPSFDRQARLLGL